MYLCLYCIRKHTNAHMSMQIWIYIYRVYVIYGIYIYTYIYILRMGTRLQHHTCSHVNLSLAFRNQRVTIAAPLAQDTTTAGPWENNFHAEAVSPLSCTWTTQLNTNKGNTYRIEPPIHRLSAVGLLRSLRAGSRGPYRWQNRIAAITHFLSLDMPSHQLPARSQILHRVSTLVEAKPQNWDQAYPDDLWLLREGDKFRQCKQLKIGTAHLGREDHLHDNRRLRWLQGLRQSLHHRIRLHRFRTLHHRRWDLINKWMPRQVVATSSLPIRVN